MSKRNETVQVPFNQQYQHDLSHWHNTTLDYFRLHPILCVDMVAKDSFSVDFRNLIQSAPLASQVFGSAHVDLHAFFVPYRLLYSQWNDYKTDVEGTNSYTLPYVTTYGIFDIFQERGVSSDINGPIRDKARIFSALHYPTFTSALGTSTFGRQPWSLLYARAYQRCWWDWYRDSVNIPESEKSVHIFTDGGKHDSRPAEFTARYRTFKKDYITTLLASPQLGNPSSAGVTSSVGPTKSVASGNNYTQLFNSVAGPFLAPTSGSFNTAASLSENVSVAALRGATAMQRFLERLNVSGSRPMERLFAMFGAKPDPVRLQMSEFVGSYTFKVNIDGLVNSGSNEFISNTTGVDGYANNAWGLLNGQGTDGGDFVGQGSQTGYAVGSGQSDTFNYTANEDGVFMVIASLIPEFANPNSVPRQMFRGLSTADASPLDFFTPDFDGLQYQEMLINEVAFPSTYDMDINSMWSYSNYDPYQVVGYQPKYEDYRYIQDHVSGDFLLPESSEAMRQLVFTRSLPENYDPSDVHAGLELTTSSYIDRVQFDKHFQIPNPMLDHFVLSSYVVINASRPIPVNQLPTELSDLANSNLEEISNGGVRL